VTAIGTVIVFAPATLLFTATVVVDEAVETPYGTRQLICPELTR